MEIVLQPDRSNSEVVMLPGQLLMQRLARYNFDQEELSAFAAYMDSAEETELYLLNPRRIAARAELDLHRTLEIAALGVREGILDLLWQIGCVGCSGPLCSFNNLRDVPGQELICPACYTHTTADADHSLRVFFSLHPSIRRIEMPSLEFAVFNDNHNVLGKEEFLKKLSQEQVSLIASLKQTMDEHPPVTGLDLLHIQLFRDFFKDQVLPVDVSLKVTRVSLVFTDLRGSTAMYAAKGDPQAYNMVRRHFDLLAQETVRYGGVIIKTIGDAVMASFRREVDATRAAIAFHRAIADFNERENLSPADALILKVGIHCGPCLSVNLNDTLDYFGTTVNTAARIAALSKGSDIMMSRTMLDSNEVKAAIISNGFAPGASMRVALRGLPEEVEVSQLVSVSQLPLEAARILEKARL